MKLKINFQTVEKGLSKEFIKHKLYTIIDLFNLHEVGKMTAIKRSPNGDTLETLEIISEENENETE